MQTHVSENKSEVEWVRELFPERKGYLDVYDHHKLCRPRAVFGHGIHLTDDELGCMHCDGLGDRALPDVEFLPGQRLLRHLPRHGSRAGRCASAWAPTSAPAPHSRSWLR